MNIQYIKPEYLEPLKVRLTNSDITVLEEMPNGLLKINIEKRDD